MSFTFDNFNDTLYPVKKSYVIYDDIKYYELDIEIADNEIIKLSFRGDGKILLSNCSGFYPQYGSNTASVIVDVIENNNIKYILIEGEQCFFIKSEKIESLIYDYDEFESSFVGGCGEIIIEEKEINHKKFINVSEDDFVLECEE